MVGRNRGGLAPIIELDGSDTGPSGIGLSIKTDNSLVRGFVVNRFEYAGIHLSEDEIFGNFAGVNNRVQGNYVGVDVTGTNPLGNSLGVLLWSGANNLVGTNGDGVGDALERNVISGNAYGIGLRGPGNLVAGNYVGLDANGNPLGNTQHGVTLEFSGRNNQIGGEDSLANTIAHNGGAGIEVGHSTAYDNSFRGNSIYSNGGLGIDLGRDFFGGNTGVTPNDPGDADAGANNLQNFPVLSAVSGGATTHVAGSLNSLAHTSFIIDFYANTQLDPSGHGEGERWLGSANIATGADGNAFLDVTLPGASSSGEYITATATDSTGNTSEFSGVVLLSNLAPTADAGGLYSVDEGGLVVLDGSGSTDPDQSTGSLTFEWDLDGDGVYGETGAAAGRGDEVGIIPTFSATGLDGFIGSSFVVGLRVTDDQGESDSDTASIMILNLDPSADDDTATALVTMTIIGQNDGPALIELNSSHDDPCGSAADGLVSINGSFSDVDLSDSHTVRVAWGDGSPTEDLAVDQFADNFFGNHSYSTGGIFTITVTIDDGNGGTDALSVTAVAQGVGLIDGVLYIIGSEGRDHVNLQHSETKDELMQ